MFCKVKVERLLYLNDGNIVEKFQLSSLAISMHDFLKHFFI